jgi:hypothetical protein
LKQQLIQKAENSCFDQRPAFPSHWTENAQKAAGELKVKCSAIVAKANSARMVSWWPSPVCAGMTGQRANEG